MLTLSPKNMQGRRNLERLNNLSIVSQISRDRDEAGFPKSGLRTLYLLPAQGCEESWAKTVPKHVPRWHHLVSLLAKVSQQRIRQKSLAQQKTKVQGPKPAQITKQIFPQAVPNVQFMKYPCFYPQQVRFLWRVTHPCHANWSHPCRLLKTGTKQMALMLAFSTVEFSNRTQEGTNGQGMPPACNLAGANTPATTCTLPYASVHKHCLMCSGTWRLPSVLPSGKHLFYLQVFKICVKGCCHLQQKVFLQHTAKVQPWEVQRTQFSYPRLCTSAQDSHQNKQENVIDTE